MLPSALAMLWLVAKTSWYWNHRPDLQFGWVVLLLCAYLCWEAWETRPAPVLRMRFWGLFLGLLGFALLFLFQIYQAAFGMKPASLVGLALGVMLVVASNLHFVFGWPGVRRFAFSFGFFLIALPMPSVVYNLLVGGLQLKIAYLNVELLNLIGIPAQQAGSLIQLPRCTVGVDEACSGIRSLQSTVMATLFIGYLLLRRTGLKILLFGFGVLLALIGNLARSFFLSYMANASGIESLEQYHDAAGWSILLFTASGVTFLAWVLGKVEKEIELQTKSEQMVPQRAETC
jgi:exosortase